MGADSALSWTAPNGQVVQTLSDEYKIAALDKPTLKLGVSYCGAAHFGTLWTSQWIRHFLENYSNPSTIQKFADELAEALNGVVPNGSRLSAFHVAGWQDHDSVASPGDIEPKVFEISNIDRSDTTKTTGFTVVDLLDRDVAGRKFVKDTKEYRDGTFSALGTPIWFGSAGVIPGFTKLTIDKLMPVHKELIGVDVPQPNITSVAEYCRFLIGSVADLQKVGRRAATVKR